MIVHPLEMHCLDSEGNDLGLVPTTLEYDAADPLAVVLTIAQSGRCIHWRFARDLIADGRFTTAGLGDVTVWPLDDQVCIHLATHRGEATLTADLLEVNAFVSDMRRLVPDGHEHIDIDALIASLMTGA